MRWLFELAPSGYTEAMLIDAPSYYSACCKFMKYMTAYTDCTITQDDLDNMVKINDCSDILGRLEYFGEYQLKCYNEAVKEYSPLRVRIAKVNRPVMWVRDFGVLDEPHFSSARGKAQNMV